MENTAYCNGCPKNCLLNALRCGRGRAYLEQQHQEGKFLEIALPASEGHDHGHDHGHSCEHRHGRGYGHGSHPGGHGGWRGEGAPDVDMENPDGLYALMRACGHVQTGSLSEILAKMESAGLIERERDETDRRRSIVRLTQTGRDRAGKCRAGEHPDMFSALNEEQKNQLKELLSILLADWKA